MKVSIYYKNPPKRLDVSNKAFVCFRVRGNDYDIKVPTELLVDLRFWDKENICYKRTQQVPREEQTFMNKLVPNIVQNIQKRFTEETDAYGVKQIIEYCLHPEDHPEAGCRYIFDYIDLFIDNYQKADSTKPAYRLLKKRLWRYQCFRQQIQKQYDYSLVVDDLTGDDIRDFFEFIGKEHEYFIEYPEFYTQFDLGNRKIRQLSRNTITQNLDYLRNVLKWCNRMGYTKNEAERYYHLPKAVHGTPVFLSLAERNQIFNVDLTDHPELVRYRDIFMFHSMVGCRVGDLAKLTKDNIIDGILVYRPEKTKGQKATVLRVPLCKKALQILERTDKSGPVLFPIKDMNGYNKAIRELLKVSGIHRLVPYMDTKTYEVTMRPIYEVVSSHTARKTFISILYDKIPDPEIIMSMTGHSPRSDSFYRYRTISEDQKLALIQMLQ